MCVFVVSFSSNIVTATRTRTTTGTGTLFFLQVSFLSVSVARKEEEGAVVVSSCCGRRSSTHQMRFHPILGNSGSPRECPRPHTSNTRHCASALQAVCLFYCRIRSNSWTCRQWRVSWARGCWRYGCCGGDGRRCQG
jgi:hypothetical protein